MAYKLIITQKAEHDLDEIVGYITGELGNTPAALHFIDEIEKKYRVLAENPYIYNECQQPLLRAVHYRKVIIGGYLMIYRINSEKSTVIIERYFNDLEDYSEKL